MDLFNHDTKILSEKMTQKHGSQLSSLACLSYLSHDYLRRVQREHGDGITAICAVLTQAMRYWSVAIGYTPEQYQDALADIEQTMQTTAYLAACTQDIRDKSTAAGSKKTTRASLRCR